MLQVKDVRIAYEKEDIVKDCSFSVQSGEIMSIIGPNGSGKSTLLKAISGFIPYRKGNILLEGKPLKKLRKKDISRVMCMLNQKNVIPNDMTVEELVSYGRYPHKKWYEKLNQADADIIEWALQKTYVDHYRKRNVSSLSGGEAQRVWIAMALAQRPKVLLLDEPTTYLDIAHQHEVLELIRELNEEINMTVVMVLHDLNQAARYSNRIFVIQKGEMQICGKTNDVMTEHMIRDVYHMDAEVEYKHVEATPRIHLICTCKDKLQADRRDYCGKSNRCSKIQ